MSTDTHRNYIYVGLAGEGNTIGDGGMYRQAEGGSEWQNITRGLPANPQVRALLVHPQNPAIIYAGTQLGPYRSDDRGDHWEALNARRGDVWSLAFHPQDPNVVYAGYEPCAIERSEDGGVTWHHTDSASVRFPHVTRSLAKRVLGIASDSADPKDMYAAIEVGGVLASRDGGDSWGCITDGLYRHIHTLDLHGVQVSAAAPGTVHVISRVGIFRSVDRGQHWEQEPLEEMFPGGSYCRSLLVAPDVPSTMYLAAGAGGGAAPRGTPDAGALFRSQDDGDSWQRVDLGEAPPSRITQIAIHPAAPSNIYCSTYYGELYTSHDSGVNWSKGEVRGPLTRSRHVYSLACG
jgi:photosystem II stability/assembly factor-like uncharacterized protein